MEYKAKSNDSFNARLRFYLFACALKGKELDKQDFLDFDIDKGLAKELVHLYVTEYQQYPTSHKVAFDNNIKDNNELYHDMALLKKNNKSLIGEWKEDYYKEVFQHKLPVLEFKKLKEVKHCHYCKTSKEELTKLAEGNKIFKKNERGFKLELDRKEPNKEYSTENCVMACYWCNNAKTDEFSEEEFMLIGKAIRTVWVKRAVEK